MPEKCNLQKLRIKTVLIILLINSVWATENLYGGATVIR
jgi:hypothetical protein